MSPQLIFVVSPPHFCLPRSIKGHHMFLRPNSPKPKVHMLIFYKKKEKKREILSETDPRTVRTSPEDN